VYVVILGAMGTRSETKKLDIIRPVKNLYLVVLVGVVLYMVD